VKESLQVLSTRKTFHRLRKALSVVSDEEFLDTDSLRCLPYGNLVLRRQSHLFLGGGVLAASGLLLLFWLAITHLDFIASGRTSHGKASANNSYEVVSTMIQLAPSPSPASKSIVASPAIAPKVPINSTVGNIVAVQKENAALHEQTAATQTELKQAIENLEAKGDIGGGAGSGSGGASSGLDGVDGDGAIFGACDIMPSFREQKKPAYPEAARFAGITGKLFVKVLIGEDGRPLKAMVLKRIPEACTAFDGVAMKSVLESTYYPATQNGRPVKVWCVIPISFRLM